MKKSFLISLVMLIVPTVALQFVASCSAGGCNENRSATPLAGFYSYSTHEPIAIDSLQIWGVGAPDDAYLVDRNQVESQTYLPFRPEYENTAFVIRYCRQALDYEQFHDTIRFWYTATPTFTNEDCGAMFFYRINRLYYSRHLIDSIAITDSLITNMDVERIQLYFRTADNDEEGGGDQ